MFGGYLILSGYNLRRLTFIWCDSPPAMSYETLWVISSFLHVHISPRASTHLNTQHSHPHTCAAVNKSTMTQTSSAPNSLPILCARVHRPLSWRSLLLKSPSWKMPRRKRTRRQRDGRRGWELTARTAREGEIMSRMGAHELSVTLLCDAPGEINNKMRRCIE